MRYKLAFAHTDSQKKSVLPSHRLSQTRLSESKQGHSKNTLHHFSSFSALLLLLYAKFKNESNSVIKGFSSGKMEGLWKWSGLQPAQHWRKTITTSLTTWPPPNILLSFWQWQGEDISVFFISVASHVPLLSHFSLSCRAAGGISSQDCCEPFYPYSSANSTTTSCTCTAGGKAQRRNKQQGTVRRDGEETNNVTEKSHIGFYSKAL